MNTKLDIKQLPKKAREQFFKVLKHARFIFIVAIIILSAFLIYEINRLTTKEPAPEQVAEQQEIIKRPKIDQQSIDKIEQLEDQNIGVQSLFKSARDNPFQD